MDEPVEKDKPWRPADHPRPGPSWAQPEDEPVSEQPGTPEHRGVPDAED